MLPPASTWQSPPTAPPSRPEVPGAPGHYFAVTVTRVAALLVDSIVIGIVGAVLGGVIGGVGAVTSPDTGASGSVGAIAGLASALVSYVYFALLWRSNGRATVGQRVFRMQVGNAFDGATLTWQQATIRWLALFGFSILVALPVIAALGGFVAFVWAIVLFVTTATSTTKQGLHDRWANSAVVATGPQRTTLAWGCLVAYVVGIVVLVVVVVGLVGLIFLGGQVQKVLAGRVEFGTAPASGCDIGQSATEFQAGTALYWAGYLRDVVPAGTTLVIESSKDGQVTDRTEYPTTDVTTCLTTQSATAPLPAGTYTIRVMRDSTVEAEGTVTVR